MSSISVVKGIMQQSYTSCNQLENNISQLVSILNMVDGSTANKVSDYIPTIEYTTSNVHRLFERMYQINSVELHILFSELNSKNREMNTKITMLKKDLSELKITSIEKYELYKYYESMEFLLDDGLYTMLINANDLKKHIPTLNNLKNDLQVFKMMVDTNNKKLRVGVRK